MANSTNSTLETVDEQPGNGFIVATFAIFTIAVNVIFFLIGLKKLEKKAHNMLVVCLCGSNCLYGLSLFLLMFTGKAGTSVKFDVLCLSQITFYFVSTSATLTIALMICIERFVTVKLNNFGSLNRNDSWKKKLTVLFLILTTVYVILCVIAVPRIKNQTKICYLEVFYDKVYYQIIMGLLSSFFMILILIITVLYVVILCIVFRVLKRDVSVAPNDNMLFIPTNRQRRQHRQKHRGNEALDSMVGQRRSNLLDTGSIIPSSSRLAGLLELEEVTRKEHIDISTKNESNQALDNKQSKDLRLGYSIKDVELLSKASKLNLKSELINDGSTLKPKECAHDELRGAGIVHCDDIDVGVCIDSARSSKSEEKAKVDNLKTATRQWELRAIATSGYVIGSTLILRGPLVLLMVIDAFGMEVPNGIGDMAAILVAVQCLIDPFIYAFRFHTIRRALKRIICCKKAEN
ncbi:unnamed protein product [Mytilus coruscus]|uniref:G-protein coupled receptors family 1 profile domain-containing protein n=1 Tax=Mytilus coruscus TaxID=42192 RepID=A0A6J8AK35_MYTCO|nr:unnamed protein product [Mytilus coruscus]